MNEAIKTDGRNKNLLIACCLFSLIVLSSSYLVQYVWKIEPCRLCKLQRIPYFFLAVLPLLVLRISKYNLIKIPFISLFVLSSLLSLYHLLVIGGFVQDFCAIKKVATLEGFNALLDSTSACSKAAWKVLYIPIAGYNFAFSVIFIFLFSKMRARDYPSC